MSSWAAGTEAVENVCISAECCWSPGRATGRQREPEREKAKWWELEQQLLLLLLLHGAAHAWEPALLPARLSQGAGASYSKILVVSGTSRSQAQRLYLFSFPAKSTCLRTPLLFLDWKVFFVINMSFLWKQVWDQEKITQSKMLKQVCREVVGFSVSFPFKAEFRQWGASVRIEFDLKHERWERQG